MDTEFQLKLAAEAGNQADGRSWLDEYKYHLGMVAEPIPFLRFQMMAKRLDKLLQTDMVTFNDRNTNHINELCKALGY